MPAVPFVKCLCGIEYRIMKLLDDRKQRYTCECGRDIEITGTVLDMHYSPSTQSGHPKQWIKVSLWKLKEVE
jgi:hypothetical protein